MSQSDQHRELEITIMERERPHPERLRAKPNETERGQWYFQLYITQLPTAGEIALFDRSWYNRAGVERVMGFSTRAEYGELLRQAPELERNLVDAGLHLFKLWFTVSRGEQARRFEGRRSGKQARLESIRHVLHAFEYDHRDDTVAHAPDPQVVQPAAALFSVRTDD